MLDPSSSRFWQAATQSGLISQANLQACWDAIPVEKREPTAVDRRIARQAVQSGFLTLWQAQQLMTGRSTGFKIDRYVLLDLLGQGGMGRVYLGLDTRLNRKIALKILSPERMNNPRARERFKREAIVGAQLQHEHLVRIYDSGESAGKCFLVMEFIEGKTIGQMIAESGSIPSPVAARLVLQVALGLEHAQRKGLIHRDVNPYNILVTRDGQAKLTDLGLALDLAENDRVTRDGATVGTFDYVSPEQARHSHKVDTRTDIYSLGCSLYHMLSGQVPYPSNSLTEKLIGHQKLEPEPLEQVSPQVPAGLALVISRMMKKNVEERYASPLAVAEALGPFADDSTELAEEAALLGGPIKSAGGTESTDMTVTNYPVPMPIVSKNLDEKPGVFDTSEQTIPPAPLSPPSSPPLPPPAVANSAGNGFGGLGFQVDLGPEPSLSQALSSPKKAKASGKAQPKSADTKVEPQPPAQPSLTTTKAKPASKPKKKKRTSTVQQLLPPLAVGLVVALLAGGYWGYQEWKKQAAKANSVAERTKKGERSTSETAADQETAVAPQLTGVDEKAEVLVVASDGTTTAEPDLATAFRSAIGAHGYVMLANKEPIDVPSEKIGSIGGGLLSIRAKPGTSPVLRVEIKARKPFIATRGDTPLKLEGLTIEARYTDPDTLVNGNPVIDAGSHVNLDHCAFRLEGKTIPTNSRALMTQGGQVVVKNSSFENFGQAFDMTIYAGTVAKFNQCLFARTIVPAAPTLPTPAALWVRVATGGQARQERSLTFERCTVLDQTFLALRDFAPRTPTKIQVNACAIRAEAALMSWGAVASPSTESLLWTGEKNRYDIKGKSWIIDAPKEAAEAPLADGPTNLETWTKLVTRENGSEAVPIKFANEPGLASEHPEPASFAVLDQHETAPVGADPKRIGPESARPAKP